MQMGMGTCAVVHAYQQQRRIERDGSECIGSHAMDFAIQVYGEVMPWTSPSRSTVMIVPPVAKHAIAFRNSAGLGLMSYLEFFLPRLPTLARQWPTGVNECYGLIASVVMILELC